jgi:lamin tail-like protein
MVMEMPSTVKGGPLARLQMGIGIGIGGDRRLCYLCRVRHSSLAPASASAVAFVALLAIVLGAAAACTEKATAKPERLCTPGNFVFCRCKDRSEGTKLCNETGTGFDPCEGCLSGSEDNEIGDPEPDPEPLPEKDGGKPPDDAGPILGTKPKAGELFITEIVYDPSGPEPSEEWFEITNVSTSARVINGLTLRDGAGRTQTVPANPPMTVEPSKYYVLVRNKPAALAAGVPASAILYEYGDAVPDTLGVLLSNGSSGALSILDGNTMVVTVPYGGWYKQEPPGGASIQLRATDGAATEKEAWCLSTAAWASADKGTPGAASVCE